MSRETIMAALFTKLTASGVFLSTGRRLVMWSQVAEQPALFLRHTGDDYHRHATGVPARVTMDCEAWIYAKTGPDVSPDTTLNALIDSIEIALARPPGFPAQTLGGLVQHAWIEGKVEIHPGDLDGQGIAVIPIKILCPAINGS